MYRHLHASTIRLDAPTSATYVLANGTTGTGVLPTAASASLAVFAYDPSWVTASPRSNYLRVVVGCGVNATAPAANFTVGLYPVSAWSGAAATGAVTLGSVATGSSVTFTAPAASSYGVANSGDFAAPTAGPFVLGVSVSAAAAASSSVTLAARVQYRQV